MATVGSRRRLGVKTLQVKDVHHVRIHYDKNMYAAHANRGGLWNFGDGEIAVAYRLKRVDYETGEGVKYPYAHDFTHSWWGDHAGIMLSRSFDNGQTWAEGDRQWIWNNDQSLEQILDWLRPVDPSQREQINMGAPDSIMHFLYVGEHLKYPFGGVGPEEVPEVDPIKGFHLGRRPHLADGENPQTFCMRSRDRGRTWERHGSFINGPDKGGGAQVVNLGYVRFDNGVLGAVGHTKRDNQQVAAFWVSYDNGISWQFLSEIARQSGPTDPRYRFTYNGVHLLPNGVLMACMHKIPGNLPCAAYSEDDGMSWSKPRFIVGPGSWNCALADRKPDQPLNDTEDEIIGLMHRAPHALVTRDGRILVVFNRRGPILGARGVLGVISDDLGETWSKEFVIRGDQYAWDGGYSLVTELPDGRFFVVYYFTEKESGQPVPEHTCVRHIAGTFFALD